MPVNVEAPLTGARPAIPRTGAFSLLLLSLGHFFIDLYASALGAFQPLLVDQHQLTLRQAGLVGGLLIFSSSVMQPVYGYFSDRLRSRLFTALAPAVAGVFISALLIAPSYAAVLAMVVAGGAGIASFHPQASAWAVQGVTSGRGRWMAIFISAGTLGMALGPTYFSTLIVRYGARNSYWGAVPGLLVTCALILFLRNQPAGLTRARARAAAAVEAGAVQPSAASCAPEGIDWGALRAVWKPLTILYFLVFIRSIVQTTYAQFLPLYLHRERGFGFADATHALSLYLAAGAVGGFVGGHLADRFGGRIVIFVSMIGSVPFLAVFFLASGWVALAGLMLGGLILLFTIPVNVVMAQDLAPGQAGTVSALMMGFSWGMAGIVFIPVTGWISDLSSMHRALSSLLAFPILGCLLTLRLPRRTASGG
ncbi:MAG: MFS transporter [Acidobacteria bacterium]|nr:MFS transporter [Acidobacteriota bacterium]